MELPKYWKMYGKTPFDYSDPKPNAVYMILFFEGKRSLLLKKDLSVLCTLETRKAKQLLEESIIEGWNSQTFMNSSLGSRSEGYPKLCNSLFYIELNRNKV